MKASIATATTLGLLLTQPVPAHASAACTGCNLVDEGSFNARLVGQTIYLGSAAYIVTGIDASRKVVYVRRPSGEPAWGDARDFYTRQARSERTAVAVAGVAGGLALFCLLGGCSSSRGSGGSAAGSSYGHNGSDYYRRSEPAPEANTPPADTSVGCAWGDRAYGTCH